MENDSINPLDKLNIYNGGGVGVGDFNNDGLQDIYFIGNAVPNRMYLNKGDMQFDDVTEKAGVGGKGGWGNELILAEDQKEYVRAVTEEKRLKHRDLMDEDYLPGILSGNRMDKGGKTKVGAGRGVNAKKR